MVTGKTREWFSRKLGRSSHHDPLAPDPGPQQENNSQRDSSNEPEARSGTTSSRHCKLVFNQTPISQVTDPAPTAQDDVDGNVERGDAEARSDPWSVSYRDAISSLTEEERKIVQKYTNLKELFDNVEEISYKHGDSLFQRGLEKLQKPLQVVKNAIDLADPLLSLDPTAKAASGAVKSVVTLAVCICGARSQFSQQIVEMLENIPIIDQCDTLGQSLNSSRVIREALATVYKDMIKFYITAIRIFESRAGVLVEQYHQKMSPIINDFNRHARQLKFQIDTVVATLVRDIKTMVLDEKVEKLLDSGKTKARSEFHSEMRRIRTDEACRWIARTFSTWYDTPTQQQMIILGDMGCGKTVTIAYVIDELLRQRDFHIPKPLLCFHYCKDGETGKATFIYSSLILQLLSQQEGLKIEFKKWYDETKILGGIDLTSSFEKLGGLFSTSIEALGRPLFVVLDGLDECDYNSRIDLLTFFNNLLERAPHFKICFSSRFQKETEDLLKVALKARVPTKVERDAIIVQHTVDTKLRRLEPDARKLVVEELNELAKGSAIWVRLSVDLIQRRKISAPGPLRRFIRNEISHTALPTLYDKLITQASQSDPDNKRIIINALQILAVAKRPLSLTELSWAVAIADLPEESRKLQDLHEVQFVHQSLKELVLQIPPSDWSRSPEISKPSKAEVRKRRDQLEANLLRLCVRYLLLDEFGSEEYYNAFCSDCYWEYSPEKRQEIESKFGEFFDYASCLLPHHLKQSAAECVPSIPDIVELTKAKSDRVKIWPNKWMRSQYRIVWLYKFMPLLDSLSLMAIYGSTEVLQNLLQTCDIKGLKCEAESAEMATRTLLEHGDLPSTKLLFRYCTPENAPYILGTFWWVLGLVGITKEKEGAEKAVGLFDLSMGPAITTIAQGKRTTELVRTAIAFDCQEYVEIIFDAVAHYPFIRQDLLCDTQRSGKLPS
ncbi:uncharacterized protein F4822DRAFT_445871 [Hypoxylon trugodes]|uniref:uncharacterized protein n=1 Tax=Hypoxylon trugodes TaxID=326681 RepID=UPI00218FD0BF|nr:uncharacterized protein F4822DRAFT_445871 [Hypoxylon trugodes]KAI1384417.1 hypothetical protein F4822DRAFT_445871 [Hypoxylon trugodes]